MTQHYSNLGNIAYLQCVGGVSGDMLLGAILSLGIPADAINETIRGLGVEGVRVLARPGQRGGVHGIHAVVEVQQGARRRYQLGDFLQIVEASSLPEPARERCLDVFRRIGEAEAKAHGGGGQLDELGDVDTLVDVVGAVSGLQALGVDRLYCSPLPSGSGVFAASHGMLPAPSPATSALFAIAGAPVSPPPGNAPNAGEMVTPTGAAIATTLAEFSQPPMRVENVGYGLGSRDAANYPNVLAMWVGKPMASPRVSTISLLETNIDDATPEILAYAQERLFAIGALDVWFTPIQMKKNRPGALLSALTPLSLEAAASDVMLRETSTLGVRVRRVERYEAERQTVVASTSLGEASVKVKSLHGVAVDVSPEYEDCRAIALAKRMPLQDVYRIIQREASDALLP